MSAGLSPAPAFSPAAFSPAAFSSSAFSSAAYWEARYAAGGDSGAGSGGALARFKAGFLNGFFAANRIASTLDFGCGDGGQLALLEPPGYLGLDVSETALARCAARFRGRADLAFRHPAGLTPADTAELGLTLDVIYHLVEDGVFAAYIDAVFGRASRFVIAYSSDVDLAWPAAHVRHRRFTDHVRRRHPGWRLLAQVPNPYPFDPARPTETSFADFFVFGRPGEACVIPVPG